MISYYIILYRILPQYVYNTPPLPGPGGSLENGEGGLLNCILMYHDVCRVYPSEYSVSILCILVRASVHVFGRAQKKLIADGEVFRKFSHRQRT